MNRFLRHLIRFLEHVMNWVEGVFCLFIIIFASYCFYDAKLVYDKAEDASLLRFKPGYEKEIEDDREILKDSMVGWITIDNTTIDYPIMQGQSNSDFINTDPYGTYSMSGSIFLDFRNSPDFSDPYSLIYGHHMSRGHMFGALDRYADEKYFMSHQHGTLTAGDKEYDLLLLAYLDVQATNSIIFSPVTTDAKKLTAFARKHAVVMDKNFEIFARTGRFVACSTCKFPDSPERTVVIGILREI